MRFSLALKASTFLLAAASALPTAVSGEVGWGAVAALAALGVAGWWLEPPLTESRRFRNAILAVAGALLVAQIARAAGGAPIARVVLEFALVLLGLKLCSRGHFGDYQQLAALGFLNVIGATITTFDLIYAVGFVAFVVLIPIVLSLAHLRGEMERRFHADGSPEGRAALGRLFASRRVVSVRFVAGVGALSLPVLALTAVLFVGFPRLGLGFFGRALASPSIAGMTNEVRIGDLDRDRDERTVVMRLEPASEAPEGGWPGVLPIKLRGAAFDAYDGERWTRRGEDEWRPLPRVGHEVRLAGGAAWKEGDGPSFDVLLKSLEPPYLFVPVGTAKIRTEHAVRQGKFEHRQLRANAAGMIRYDDDARVGIRYGVFLSGAAVPGGAAGAESPAYREIPPGNERLAAEAVRIAGSGPDEAKVARIVTWLQREHAYGPPAAGGAQGGAVEAFLFGTRRGTCEHFATSAALMLRAAGIPARFVTGFGSADFNAIGGYYAVHTGAAHAWVEAFVGGQWRTIEATPPAPPGLLPPPPSKLAQALDALRMRWHKYVIGFDIATQMELGSWLMERRRARELERFAVPWKLVGAAALALAAAFVAFRRLRAGRARGPRGGRARRRGESEAAGLYAALDRRLRALGYARPPHVTPLEHLAALPPGAAGLRSGAAAVTARYNEVRFGGAAFSPGERRRLLLGIRGLGA